MKNKFLIILIFLSFFCKNIWAQDLLFETKNLKYIENKDIIIATYGKAYTVDNDIEIVADKFEYSKKLNILRSNNNGFVKIKSENLEIKFDKSIFKVNDSLIEFNGKTIINYLNAKIQIYTDEIILDQKNNLIKSSVETLIEDANGTQYLTDNFLLNVKTKVIRFKNLTIKDNKNNHFKSPLAYLNIDSGKIFGKDIQLNLNANSADKNFQPRIKGNSFENDDQYTKIKKGVFTSCKKRDECPPWEFSAEEISHDKNKRTINYKNAVFRVYDFPLVYFPKFFHPDPSVKRQSGFLMPTFKTSNKENYLSTPYFFAIADNKDATFYPRFYDKDKLILQNEFRQVNRDSESIADFGVLLDGTNNTKSHFFYDFNKNLEVRKFDNSHIDLKIQQTSNDTYLRKNKISSEIVNENNILENSINLNLINENTNVNLQSVVYEDLSKVNNDRFDYIFPKIDLIKKIENNTKLNGNFIFESQVLARNYDTNILEKKNINDLVFNSNSWISKNGLLNNYKFLIKNTNSDAENSNEIKNKSNNYLSGILQYNSSYPLIKKNKNFNKIFTPRMSVNIAPSFTPDITDKNFRIDTDNIYSIDRTTNKDFVEGGASLVYGGSYSLVDKSNFEEVFSLKLANNLRIQENKDLPGDNQIGQKVSNIFSEINYRPIQNLDLNYKTSIKNNFSDISYEDLKTSLKVNRIETEFSYLNENITSEKNSFLSNKTSYIIDDFNSFSFSTRKNKTKNLTEYYKLMYEYKNDCLAASIEYDKDYYDDRDLKPNESILFKLTIIPFGQVNTPNLKN